MPGTLITREQYSAERFALLDELSAQARAAPMRLAPGAIERMNHEYTGLRRFGVGILIDNLDSDPRAALADPAVVKLLTEGVVRTPVLDQAKLRRLLQIPPSRATFEGEEQVEARLLDPDQLTRWLATL